MAAGGLDIDDSAGFDVAGPDRESVRFAQRLNVSAEVAGLPGEPGVDRFAFHTGGFGTAPVGVEDFAVQDQVGNAVVGGAVEGVVQVGGLVGEDVDGLVEVAVGGGL